MTDLKEKICTKSFIYLCMYILNKLIFENNFISFVLCSVKKKGKKKLEFNFDGAEQILIDSSPWSMMF